jgi:putative PIN family toxin of toxin-antitoxin system
VSGILFGGHSRQILNWSSRGKLTNFISDEILNEVKEVLLRSRFKLTHQQVNSIIALFHDTFDIVYPAIQHNVIQSDLDDNLFLDAAMEARVEVIVSGDKHLLSLESWRGIRMLSPTEFVTEFEGVI